jgi:DNA-binding transcriptional LysR family regulator
MSQITIRQLKALVTVADLGSFIAAGRALHVTASALSILIGELEKTLGFRVLDRTTRRVTVSAAGQDYLPYAQRVLDSLEAADRRAVDLRSQKTGVVRIATSQIVAWTLMPRVYSAFRQLRPEVRLEPLDLPMDQVLPSLESGMADLAITLNRPSDELQSIPIFASRMHLACRPDHPWASRKRLRWSSLAGKPLIFTGAETPQRIMAALPGKFELMGVRQTEHAGSALALVASGLGDAICAGYVKPLADIHGLRLVAMEQPTVLREFGIYFHKRRAPPPAVEGFRDFLVDYFARHCNGVVEDAFFA